MHCARVTPDLCRVHHELGEPLAWPRCGNVLQLLLYARDCMGWIQWGKHTYRAEIKVSWIETRRHAVKLDKLSQLLDGERHLAQCGTSSHQSDTSHLERATATNKHHTLDAGRG